MVVTAVQTDVELDVTHIHCMDVGLELNTLVIHITAVDIYIAVTHRTCLIARDKHVVGQFVEIVKLYIQILADTELQTEVNSLCTLPSDIRCSVISPRVTDLTFCIFNAVLVFEQVRTDTLVTQSTPAQTQFTIFEPWVSGLHELLVGEGPCHTYGTKVTPTFAFGELTGTVSTVGGVDHVFLIIHIVGLCEYTLQSGLVGRRTHVVHLDGVAPFQTCRVRDVTHVTAHALTLGETEFVARQYVNAVCINSSVVFQQLLTLEEEVVALALVDTADTGSIAIELVRQLRGIGTYILHGGTHFEFQTFVEFEIKLAIYADLVLLGVGFIVLQGTGRVDTATETTTETFVHTIVVHLVTGLRVYLDVSVLVIFIHRIDGRNTVHVCETVIHVTALSGVVHIRIGVSDIHRSLQPFLGLKVNVASGGETVVVRTDIVTFILQVAEAGEILYLARTAGDTCRHIGLLTRTENGFLPRGQAAVLSLVLYIGIESSGALVNQQASLFVPQVVHGGQTVVVIEQVLAGHLRVTVFA